MVTSQESTSRQDLEAMTKEELERICFERGFEMVQDEIDESTGEPYQLTHQDYIEAAQRCLSIEQEM
jgi:DNA invertase Pin-like site-specific DNA recombinase